MNQDTNLRLSFMKISGELLLELIKNHSDLPDDTKLIDLKRADPKLIVGGQGKDVEFIISSSKFNKLHEGMLIPEIMPISKNRG